MVSFRKIGSGYILGGVIIISSGHPASFLGALYFYKVEEALETERFEAMKAQDSNISDSIEYTAHFLTDIHYNPAWTYNNCTRNQNSLSLGSI
jgi:hypothetical protein